MILRLLLFLVIFVITVVVNFPYDRAIADRVARLEMRTGTQVDYTPVSASVSGVEWKDVNITTRTGMQTRFDQARLRPTWQGMSAHLVQGKAQARLSLGGEGKIDLRMDQLKINSGSPKFGTMVATGNVTHNLNRQLGEGSLRLEMPDHHLALPIDIPTFELGSRLFWQNRGAGYELRAEVKMTGGSQITAEGNILLDPQPGAPHRLSGTINFQTQLGKGKYTLMGTWKEPSWNVEYYK